MLFVTGDSVDCDWVRLVLAEKDVDGAQVQLVQPGAADEDFLVLNPAQTVPTLADREGVLIGARVIAEYLDERYPHPPLMPQEPAARARARMALQHLEQDLFPLVVALGGPARAAAAARSELLTRLRRSPRHLASQGWYLGREFSLIDCAWAALLRRLGAHGVEPHGAETEGLRRYAARLGARPSYKRSFEVKPAGGRK
jgi:RNA polymerase-associated protein